MSFNPGYFVGNDVLPSVSEPCQPHIANAQSLTPQRLYCRFCGEEKTEDDLLDLSIPQEYNEYLQKLLHFDVEYLQLDFSLTNKLLKTTCQPCFDSLDDAVVFLKKVRNTQIILNTVQIKDEPNMEERPTDTVFPSYENVKCSFKDKMATITNFKMETEINNDFKINDEQELGEGEVTIELKREVTEVPEINNVYEALSNVDSDYVADLSSLFSVDFKEQPTPVNPQPRTVVTAFEYYQESWLTYPWQCVYCDVVQKSMEDVRTHSKLMHNKCFGFKCADCTHNFVSFNTFVEHVRCHRQYLRFYCQYCNVPFASAAECQQHGFAHWRAGPVCARCGAAFDDAAALQAHLSNYKQRGLPKPDQRRAVRAVIRDDPNAHEKVKSWEDYQWTCQDCFMPAPSLAALRAHCQRAHGRCFAARCMDCLRNVYLGLGALVPHARLHRPNLKHFCHYCNKRYENLDELETHIEAHRTSRQRPCEYCGQIFKNHLQLKKHMVKYNVPKQRGQKLQDERICNICEKEFTTMGGLKAHLTNIHNKYSKGGVHVCDVCGEKFTKKISLKYHMERHIKERNEVCTICQSAFKTKRALHGHMKLHSDNKYTCDYCNRQFNTKRKVSNHIYTKHILKYDFKCEVCSKQFNKQLYLINHMRTHTQEKPFVCTECFKKFSCWGNCNKHMIRIHGTTLNKNTRIRATRSVQAEVQNEPQNPGWPSQMP